ncbi:carbohydrate kinase family protein [Sulfitobacter pontiacus]|uniref:carbohydrate kinase family protein n=1 Tax=Sulfitobacter pontiacus TaxID=60137 RepID=UPI000452EA71|nr:carbohydrate kinase [Sulfitobacter pontiacus]KAJ29116.1 carbohydrate kinase [Sulfitobacter pontiacus 3SOLIMAR09]
MILCCGEALIDMIPTPTLAGPEGFVPHVGGAIFNTAIALGRLGIPTGMLTGLSTDMFGIQLAAALKASHVDTSRAVVSNRPTTLAFVQLNGGQATYNFVDEGSAGRMLTPVDMPTLTTDVSALYLGGISLASEPSADAYIALLKAEGAQRPVMIDPNIRPGLVDNIPAYRSRLEGAIGLADLVKVSDEDLEWLVPGPSSLKSKATALLELGPDAVILTRGAEGATGYLKSGAEVQIPAVRAKVIDTVGAGDTFNAGVLAHLFDAGELTKMTVSGITPETLQSAIEYGAKVAAITISRAGANPPWRSEVG